MKGPRRVNPLPGRRLRRLVQHGESVEIAGICGVSAQTLSNYLTGKRALPNEVLSVLARHFNVSTDDLLAPEGESPLDAPPGGAAHSPRAGTQGDEEALVAAWRRLDPSRRDYGLMFLKVLADGQCLEWALAEAHAYAAERALLRASAAPAGPRRELRVEAGRSGDTPPRGPNRKDSAT